MAQEQGRGDRPDQPAQWRGLDFSFLTPPGSRQTRACQDSLTRLFPMLEAATTRTSDDNYAS